MSESQKQWLFFGSILLLGLVAVFGVALTNQAAAHQVMFLAGKAGEGLLWFLSLVIFCAIWIIILFGSGAVGHYLHKGIKSLDGNIAYDLTIPNWGHWLIAAIFSLVLLFVWVWFVPFLVTLPTWVNAMYVSMGWLSTLKETPIWCGVYGMIMFLIGYATAVE